MPRRPTAGTWPEDLLEEHTPKGRALAERLRKIIRQTVPEATETVYSTWHGIGYRHPKSGYFCAIFPGTDHVQMGFELGVLLPDPDGLLTGTGRQVRYMLVRGARDIKIRAIKKLLRAAINLPGREALRLSSPARTAKR